MSYQTNCSHCMKSFEEGEDVVSITSARMKLLLGTDDVLYDDVGETESIMIFCNECYTKIEDYIRDPLLSERMSILSDLSEDFDYDRELHICLEAGGNPFDFESTMYRFNQMMVLTGRYNTRHKLKEIYEDVYREMSPPDEELKVMFKKAMIKCGADPDLFCPVCGQYECEDHDD
ncbi:MAG: hypothetical protein SVK08_02060 [Halobacteriota archaeon]|nr:hypothetical protein [Halobacteriota archaeon]